MEGAIELHIYSTWIFDCMLTKSQLDEWPHVHLIAFVTQISNNELKLISSLIKNIVLTTIQNKRKNNLSFEHLMKRNKGGLNSNEMNESQSTE